MADEPAVGDQKKSGGYNVDKKKLKDRWPGPSKDENLNTQNKREMGQVHPVGSIRKPAGFPAEVGGIPSKQTDEPEGQKPSVHGLDQAV